jgi:exoribonuclease-2
MLPERLSTDLTSLNQDEDRMALVVELRWRRRPVASSSVGRAVVRNHAKLAYDSVAAWLDGRAPAPERSARSRPRRQLRVQDESPRGCARSGTRRRARARDREARPVFDGDLLLDLRPDEKNRAKELIEEFMVAANGATARFLAEKGFPSLRRVLRSPERWERIVALARDSASAARAAGLDRARRVPRAPAPRGSARFPISRCR